MGARPPFEHDELVRRISRDLADGYDEELEMEIEDRHPLPRVSSAPEADTEKRLPANLFPTVIPAPSRTRETAGLGGRFWTKGFDPI